MSIDLTAADAANKAVQADTTIRKALRTEAAAVNAALHQLAGVPDPPPPPPPPPGGVWLWDATTATVDPNSAAIVADFVNKAGLPGYLNAGNAIVTASASDPTYAPAGGHFDANVHIPANTKAGCDDDGHLGIIGPGGRSHDMYQGKFANGQWTCNGGGSYDSNAVNGGLAASVNAATIPQTRGLLAPEDLLPGAKPHPLVFSVSPACFGAATRYPGLGQNYPGSSLVGLGMWFRFPPGLVFSGLPTLELTICRFLQACGGFIRDGGDPLNVCALDCVNRGGNQAAWGAVGVVLPSTVNGYPYARQLGAIPWSKLQALRPPSP